MTLINTTKGPIEASALARTVGFEDRPSQFVLWVEWKLFDELVRREAYPLPKHTDTVMFTTKGVVDVARLVRTIELQDLPNEFAIGVVWTLDGELVRRDAHVILKQPTVTADAVVGGFHG